MSLRYRSKKATAKYRERRRLVRRILSEPVPCVVCDQARATAIHEPLTRARGGSILDESNCMAVCFDCHRRIHEDRNGWATARGFLVHSWDRCHA